MQENNKTIKFKIKSGEKYKKLLEFNTKKINAKSDKEKRIRDGTSNSETSEEQDNKRIKTSKRKCYRKIRILESSSEEENNETISNDIKYNKAVNSEIMDDEDWNCKSKIKSEGEPNLKHQIHSVSELESTKISCNQSSNSEIKLTNMNISNDKSKKSMSQDESGSESKFDIFKHKNSASNSIQIDNSKTLDIESENTDDKSEQNVSQNTPNSASNSIHIDSRKGSNYKSEKCILQDKLKSESKFDLLKCKNSAPNSIKVNNSKTLDIESENTDDESAQNISQDTLNSASNSIQIDSSKDSDSESEKSILQDKLKSESKFDVLKCKNSAPNSIKVDNSKTLDIESENTDDESEQNISQNTLNSASNSIQIDSSKDSDSESEKSILQDELKSVSKFDVLKRKNSALNSIRVDNSKTLVIESENTDDKSEQNISQNTSERDSIHINGNKVSDSESERNKPQEDLNSESRLNVIMNHKHSESNLTKVVNNKVLDSESVKETDDFSIKTQNIKSKDQLIVEPNSKIKRKFEYSKLELGNNPTDSESQDLKCESNKRSTIKQLYSGCQRKKVGLQCLDNFLREKPKVDHVIENSEKSSDLEIEIEDDEFEFKLSDLDTDLEDDTIEISNVYTARTSYRPTVEEVKKLKNMEIKLMHIVPPQHKVEATAGTRTLTKEERSEFEKYVTLKHGTYTKNEDSILLKNWLTFCKLHDWNSKNSKPFLQMKYKNKEFFLHRKKMRVRFVQFLAKGLFNRSLYSVYQRFRVLLNPHKVTRYNQEEDKIIINFMKKQPNSDDTFVPIKDRKFADLALILKRTRASVWRRYRLLQKKRNKKTK